MCEIVPTVPNHRRSYHQLLDRKWWNRTKLQYTGTYRKYYIYTMSSFLDAEAFERDSAKLLLEYWLQLQMLIKNENNGPTWDQFVSLYGKVMTMPLIVMNIRRSKVHRADTLGCLTLKAWIYVVMLKPMVRKRIDRCHPSKLYFFRWWLTLFRSNPTI